MLYLDTSPGVPFDFNAIYGLLKDHAGLAILAVILFLVWKYAGDVGTFFKDYWTKKMESESKLADTTNKTVDKLGDAVSAMKEAFVSMRVETIEKINGVEVRLGEKIVGVENRLSEKIASSAKEVVHHGKLDKIASSLDRLDGGEDSEDGDPK